MLFKNGETLIENSRNKKLKKARGDILRILSAALNSVDPYNSVKSSFKDDKLILKDEEFDLSNFENIFLVGFGKASIGMAQAVCDSINVDKGVVITNEGKYEVKSSSVKTYVGSHPIPNENSLRGAREVLNIVQDCGEKDLLLVAISGGGSALLSKPIVSLQDLQSTTELLLKCGANINEINTVRKHLSDVKGGKLAKNASCTVVSLIISDIVGDPIQFIASGPTYPDSTTYQDAKKVFEKYSLWNEISKSVRNVLDRGIKGDIEETPKMDDPVFDDVYNSVVANNELACNAAKSKADRLGYKSLILTTSLTGEAREMGEFLVKKAKNFIENGERRVSISGGETTVTVKGNGQGGRNQEMVLGAVEELSGSDLVFASFGTDGIDGNSDAAGAIADGYTLERGKNKNLDIFSFLEENNSYVFFKELDDLLFTGPTGTNVMDIQVVVRPR